MTAVVRNTQAQQDREFIGKAWKNVVSKEGSKFKGVEFIRVTLDSVGRNAVESVTMSKGHSLLLWPNAKREGTNPKTGKPYNDADFRVSLVHQTA